MPRFRRYRVFLIFAAIVTFALYKFWQTQPAYQPLQASFGGSQSTDAKSAQSNDQNGAEPARPAVDIQGIAHPPDQLPITPAESIPTRQPSVDPAPVAAVEASSTERLSAEPTQPFGNSGGVAPSDELVEPTAIHWKKQTEHYPVPTESLIHLPTGTPKKFPRIQHEFPAEAADAKAKREERQDKVKKEFLHAWNGYKKNAWGHDELRPLNGGSKDPFCGWAATMVDALDTLWIMGLKEEFEEAVEAVEKIDFTTTPKSSIPVFETTIRYLGGLLAAYDISNAQYPILLDKAIELGEILMGVFDTPNRMPVLHYAWQPTFASVAHRASSNSNFAELGTLSMEFTRLAQLTGEHKYYDAVARITNALVDWQKRGTAIKGVFPDSVDASGCNATVARTTVEKLGRPKGSFPRRTFIDNDDCTPQGLISNPSRQSFSMGGGQDSTYEYFSKMWLLLGGLDTAYRTLYLDTMEAIRTHLLYRPLIPDDRDVLFTAKITVNPRLEGSDGYHDVKYEVTHLTCFLGGMVGMGSKLFELDSDMTIAERLTDGCVWAYDSTPSGIMPEDGTLVPCENPLNCPWDKEQYYRYLDPRWADRDHDIEVYDANKAKREKERIEKEAQAKLEAEAEEKALAENADAQDTTSYSLNGSAVGVENETESEDSVNVDDTSNPDTKALESRSTSSNVTSDSTDALPVLPPVPPTRTTTEGVPMNPAGRSLKTDNDTPRVDPYRPLTHEAFIKDKVERYHLPLGFSHVAGDQYILRPEAIESVFYMHRITGADKWAEKGWRMFEAIIAATRTEIGHSAVKYVNRKGELQIQDSMESFWLAETLKYFYLLYSEPDLVSLDDWVLNTEAHPFKRPS